MLRLDRKSQYRLVTVSYDRAALRLRLWALLVLLSCAFGLAINTSNSCAAPGLSALDIGVDAIHAETPNPYVELRYLHLTTHAYTESKPFSWLLMTSAYGVWYPQVSTDLIVKVDNRTDYDGQNASISWNKESTIRRWNLTRVDEFSYKMGFLFALKAEITFEPAPLMHVTMLDETLEDEWRHVETSPRRLDGPPDNGTLTSLGLNTMVFWNLHRINGYKTFYLYEVTFIRPESYRTRVSYTFTLPAILLFFILVVSVVALFFARLSLQSELTLYLGTAFFSLPFVLNYTRLGLGPITFTESLFYGVIAVSTGLAFVSVFLSACGKQDNESLREFCRRCRSRDKDYAWAADC